MGTIKKKLTWKETLLIAGFGLAFISFFIMLAINWDWTLNRLKAIWNIARGQGYFYLTVLKYLLLTLEGRQIVLSLLVVGLIIWLVFLKKKIREKKPELDARHRVILESLISNEGRSTSFGLQNDYKKKFGYINKKDFGICTDDLLELGYMKYVGVAGPGFNIYLLTRTGARYIKKFIVENEAP